MKLSGTQGNLIFALNHPIRRSIIEILNPNRALNSTELSSLLNISLCRCFYHLDNLTDLIKQDKKQRILLSEKGINAYNLLHQKTTIP